MDYGMYTDAGNHAVEAIVRRARILQMQWANVAADLNDLAHRYPEFAEATDTEVRECVYCALGFD